MDLRARQKRAVVRMFDDVLLESTSHSAQLRDDAFGGRSHHHHHGDIQYKILILDKFTFDVIAPLLKVNELRQHGITLTLLLESEREQIPDLSLIHI